MGMGSIGYGYVCRLPIHHFGGNSGAGAVESIMVDRKAANIAIPNEDHVLNMQSKGLY